jgi:hypothetical protein
MESSRYHISEPKIQRLCRQGLLLYLATVLNGLPSIASNFDMLGANIVVGLQDLASESEVTQGLRLWLALIIATIVCDEMSKSWARREFATIVSNSSPRRKEDVKARLETFFWVNDIHGPRLDELWNRSFGNL